MEIIIPSELDGARLDSARAELSGLSRSRVARLIEEGRVRAGLNARTKSAYKARAGERFLLEIPPSAEARSIPQDIPLEILYDDADIAIINKPRGMVVHPAPGNPDGTLVNALLHHLDGLSGLGGELRPGIVHRLDKDTTGIMVVAKNDFSHRVLSEQFAERTAKKSYLALLRGNLKADEGRVDAPIARHPKDRKRMAARADGRSALTLYTVLRRYAGACLVRCDLCTGRTHQIRVHMAHIGHPVLEDPLYGGGGAGQLLHSWTLGFVHPRSAQALRFTAKPDAVFLHSLRQWEKQLMPIRRKL